MEKKLPHTPYNIMKSSVDNLIIPSPDEIRKINSFFLVRYISNDPASIYIANALNCMHKIPMEAQYSFVLNSTLDKVAFINYPKKEKIVSNKELKVIANHFKINDILAKEYVTILGLEKTQEILDKYEQINYKKTKI
jgi:predicted choloylglycine hydrolase